MLVVPQYIVSYGGEEWEFIDSFAKSNVQFGCVYSSRGTHVLLNLGSSLLQLCDGFIYGRIWYTPRLGMLSRVSHASNVTM